MPQNLAAVAANYRRTGIRFFVLASKRRSSATTVPSASSRGM
jgi:hypothetical protein